MADTPAPEIGDAELAWELHSKFGARTLEVLSQIDRAIEEAIAYYREESYPLVPEHIANSIIAGCPATELLDDVEGADVAWHYRLHRRAPKVIARLGLFEAEPDDYAKHRTTWDAANLEDLVTGLLAIDRLLTTESGSSEAAYAARDALEELVRRECPGWAHRFRGRISENGLESAEAVAALAAEERREREAARRRRDR